MVAHDTMSRSKAGLTKYRDRPWWSHRTKIQREPSIGAMSLDVPWVMGTRHPVAVSSSVGNSAQERGVFSISWDDAGVSRAGRRKDMGSVRLMADAVVAEAEAAEGEEVV